MVRVTEARSPPLWTSPRMSRGDQRRKEIDASGQDGDRRNRNRSSASPQSRPPAKPQVAMVRNPGLELTVELSADAVSERAVQAARKRIGRGGGVSVCLLILIRRNLLGRLKCLVCSIGRTLNCCSGSGGILCSKQRLQSEDHFLDAILARAKLLERADNVVELLIRRIKSYAIDFSIGHHNSISSREFNMKLQLQT